VGVDASAAEHVAPGNFFNGSTDCAANSTASDCRALAADEWLADQDFWTPKNATTGECIYAMQSTVLKKSTAESQYLLQSQLLSVDAEFPCRLLTTEKLAGYWLCKHSGSHPPPARQLGPVVPRS
jgi:hypothetical protein